MRVISLKTCIVLMILSTSSDLMSMLFALLKKGMILIERDKKIKYHLLT